MIAPIITNHILQEQERQRRNNKKHREEMLKKTKARNENIYFNGGFGNE